MPKALHKHNEEIKEHETEETKAGENELIKILLKVLYILNCEINKRVIIRILIKLIIFYPLIRNTNRCSNL